MDKIWFKTSFLNLEISGDEHGICEIEFSTEFKNSNTTNKNLNLCVKELDSYFKGKLKNFSVKLNLGGTEFEKDVYKALLSIPYGKTVSYKDIACKIARPKAYRAVGNANAKNKIPIIIPCHRVIATNGLGGYSGGLEIKKALLNLEGINLKTYF
ncbi:MAG: methylated-DNA--[protein]-cysteine S-methyltransferase [Campylobacter sp.]|nr:methylated-DNA--[protein]-cysteine S-methyltransferase [Campylobacter sp.]